MRKTAVAIGLVLCLLALMAPAATAAPEPTERYYLDMGGEMVETNPLCVQTWADQVGGPYIIPNVVYEENGKIIVDYQGAINFAAAVGFRAVFATYDLVWCTLTSPTP